MVYAAGVIANLLWELVKGVGSLGLAGATWIKDLCINILKAIYEILPSSEDIRNLIYKIGSTIISIIQSIASVSWQMTSNGVVLLWNGVVIPGLNLGLQLFTGLFNCGVQLTKEGLRLVFNSVKELFSSMGQTRQRDIDSGDYERYQPPPPREERRRVGRSELSGLGINMSDILPGRRIRRPPTRSGREYHRNSNLKNQTRRSYRGGNKIFRKKTCKIIR